jgi:predicted nuclease of predicted toxin-antitoxin system
MATISLYFDEMMARPAAEQLVKRGYSVIMAVDVDMTGKTDPEHLQYATEAQRVMVTFDRPFATLTTTNPDHAGLACITGATQGDIGGIVRLLLAFIEQYQAEDVVGKVYWLK